MDLAPASEGAIQAQLKQALPRLLGQGLRLGIYWPLPGEIDLRPQGSWETVPLALPAIAADQLTYRAWRPGDPLAADACGIPAPLGPALPATELGCLLVPALALDPRGVRLGYGGGWYDRLRADPLWRAVPSVVVLPRGCLKPALPRDPWDVPFDAWLDETGLHPCTDQA
jgi:5-formyltetrahydrofolate cyclo-ligase